VQFVIIDLDKAQPPEQEQLVKKFYTGYIPYIVVLDAEGRAVYNQAGEVSEAEISRLLDRLVGGRSK
jgi:thioredoxin-like negative regulator of GroEL